MLLLRLGLLLSAAALLISTCAISRAQPSPRHWAVVLHGGAGVVERASMTPEREAAYRASLHEALAAASTILERGGSSLDAVEAAIRIMEDDPLFNAGRGAVFSADGRNELDAAIMDGATMKAGAVAGVTRTRHPITLARAVMDRSPHVFLIGAGADEFAREKGIEQVEPSFFFTERRWESLMEQLKKENRPIPPRPPGAPPAPSPPAGSGERPDEHKFGTVGVVALDRNGNLAAGTSTGGTQGKLWGRVGDTPIIGAGTYAANGSCAVSATGAGEYFIRLTIARDICALVEYKGMPLQAAANEVIHKHLTAFHGDGGVIALSRAGELVWAFNTPGMYRARASEGGIPQISIYKDEP